MVKKKRPLTRSWSSLSRWIVTIDALSSVNAMMKAVIDPPMATRPKCSGSSRRASTATLTICSAMRRIWADVAIAPPRIVWAASCVDGRSIDR
jgi:hypothetical protein